MARVGTTREKGLAGRRRAAAAALAALLCLQALPAAALAGAQEPGQPEAADVASEGEGDRNGGYDPDGVNGNGPGEGAGTEEGAQDSTGAGGEDEDAAGSGGSEGDGTDAETKETGTEGEETTGTEADGPDTGANPAAGALPEPGAGPLPLAARAAGDIAVSDFAALKRVFDDASADGTPRTAVVTADIDVTGTLALTRGEVTLVSDGGRLVPACADTLFSLSDGAVLNLGRKGETQGVTVAYADGGDMPTTVVGGETHLWAGTRVGRLDEGASVEQEAFCFAEGDETHVTNVTMHRGSSIEGAGIVFSSHAGGSRFTTEEGSAIVDPAQVYWGSAYDRLASTSSQMSDRPPVFSIEGGVIEMREGGGSVNMPPFVACYGAVLRMSGGTVRGFSPLYIDSIIPGVLPDWYGSFEAVFSIEGGVFEATGGTVEGCSSPGWGSIVAVSAPYTDINGTFEAVLDLSGVTFQNNEIGYGGVVFAAEFYGPYSTRNRRPKHVALENCTFTGNAVADADAYEEDKVAVVRLGGAPSGTLIEWNGGATPLPLTCPVTIKNCTFAKNSTLGIAGALYADNVKDLTVEGCSFTDNTSHAGAGAELKGPETSAVLTDCVFEGNYAHGTDPLASGGGALYVHDGAVVEMTGGRISGNSAEFHGGGVWASGGARLTMTDVTVSGNTTPAHGGGVSVPYKKTAGEEHTAVTMTGCTVSGNAAGEFGGGVQAMSGTVELVDCTVAGNVAGSEDPGAADAALAEGSHGGGIWAESGLGHLPPTADPADYAESPATIKVTGGTVSGNRAGDHAGGAGASQGARLEMTGVEVSDNRAGDHGGGVLSQGANSSGSASLVLLEDCEVSGNFAANHGGGVGAAWEVAAAGRAGDGTDRPAGSMRVVGGAVTGNSTDGEGGGACAEAGAFMDLGSTKVYGNSAKVAADGVNVHDGATVVLGSTAVEAELPCGHLVDGWYYDDAGARWYDLVNQDPPVARPLDDEVTFDGPVIYQPAADGPGGTWVIRAGDHSLKDAHGPDPHISAEPDAPAADAPVADAPAADDPATGAPAAPGAPHGTGSLSVALPATGDGPAAALAGAGALLAAALAALSARRLRLSR